MNIKQNRELNHSVRYHIYRIWASLKLICIETDYILKI